MSGPFVLVTAGAQGLGGAISKHLVRRGYSVIVHHHRSEGLADAIVADAHKAGLEAHTVMADLSTIGGRNSMMEEVDGLLRGRPLHVLINNLGIYPLEHLLAMSIETFEHTFALTCTTVFHLTKLALPMLERANRKARIINVGDSNCDRIEAHDDAPAYHIAKLGVHVLTRTFAQQLGPKGITVNMVSPGFLENSVGQPDTPIPLGRKGTFSDIVAALDFLLSDGAAYVSGTNLRVSGAWNL